MGCWSWMKDHWSIGSPLCHWGQVLFETIFDITIQPCQLPVEDEQKVAHIPEFSCTLITTIQGSNYRRKISLSSCTFKLHVCLTYDSLTRMFGGMVRKKIAQKYHRKGQHSSRIGMQNTSHNLSVCGIVTSSVICRSPVA